MFMDRTRSNKSTNHKEEAIMNDEFEYEYQPADYYDLFNFEEPPSAKLWEPWRKEEEEEPTSEQLEYASEYLACLITEEDGSEYFYFRDVCIEISEHFCATGKPLDVLMQDVIQHAAKESPVD